MPCYSGSQFPPLTALVSNSQSGQELPEPRAPGLPAPRWRLQQARRSCTTHRPPDTGESLEGNGLTQLFAPNSVLPAAPVRLPARPGAGNRLAREARPARPATPGPPPPAARSRAGLSTQTLGPGLQPVGPHGRPAGGRRSMPGRAPARRFE